MANNQQGRGQSRGGGNQTNAAKNALTVVSPPRMALPAEAKELGYNVGQWTALVDSIWPSATSVNGVLLALNYCKARNLDPFKRPVHIVPMYSAALKRNVETVWPGISEIRTTATRTGTWAGVDECVFGRIMKKSFRATKSGDGENGPWSSTVSCPEISFPEWAQVTVYRIVQGLRVPFVGPKVYFEEIFSGQKSMRVPNERWQNNPRQMLEKCAEAAALRRAFPEELANEYTAEEMEGQTLRGETVEAKYAVVEESEQEEGEQDDAGGDAGGNDQDGGGSEDDALNGWKPKMLAGFMKFLRGGIPSAPNKETLDEALAFYQKRIATLPAEEGAEIAELIAAARAKFDGAGNTDTDQGEASGAESGDADDVDDRQDADADVDTDSDAQDSDAREEPPFLVNFRVRISAVELLTDLKKLETVEKRVIENQPAWVAKICDELIEEKRTALAPRT